MSSRASSVRPNPSDPQLPKEIIDDIIDYLASDVAALRAFALTGRTFLHRARIHLFGCITLEGGPAFLERGVTPGRKFLALVQQSPDLLGYIREVRVINMNEEWMDDWVGSDLALGFSIGVFLRILKARLPALGANAGVAGPQVITPLSVSLRSVVLEHLDLDELPGGHKISLEDLVVFPTLKDVTLKHIRGIAWETCDRFPRGLENLWLFAVNFDPQVVEDSVTDDEWETSDAEEDSEDDSEALPDDVPRLQSTRLRRGCRVLISARRARESFPSLRALVIHRGSLGRDGSLIFADNTPFPLVVSDLRVFLTSSWSEREWRHNEEILARIIPTNLLDSFGLGFFWGRDGPLPEYDLSPCTNLRTIHIGTYSDFHTFALQAAFVWLHGSLKSLPRANRLERIIVRCCLSPRECSSLQRQPASEESRLKRDLGWADIDKTLSGTRFASLRNIHLRLSINEGTTTGRYAMLINSLPVILPRLMKSDIVTIESENKRFRWPPERVELY